MADDAWAALRAIRDALRAREAPPRRLGLRLGPGFELAIDGPPPDGGTHGVQVLAPGSEAPPPLGRQCVLACNERGQLEVRHPGDLPPAVASMLRLYLPYCLAAPLARARGRAFVVTHFAQSLDGRIACEGGDSKWIGCADNQSHAHRMRALCDAVLVGRRTLELDRPRLTVRHVAGEHPVRVVLGTRVGDLGPLLDEPGEVLVIGGRAPGTAPVGRARVEVVPLPHGPGGGERERRVAELLLSRGLRTVLIEGGAATTSAFLGAGMVDVVQVHLAPLLLGSGVAGFAWPGSRRIGDGVRLEGAEYLPVGDGLMVVGRPLWPAPGSL